MSRCYRIGVTGRSQTCNNRKSLLKFPGFRSGVQWHYIAPRKPTQNGFIESVCWRDRRDRYVRARVTWQKCSPGANEYGHLLELESMKNLGSSFNDRLETAAKAKRALLERARAKLATSNAGEAERSAARLAIVTARDVRAAQRMAAKETERLRLEQEHRAKELAREAELAAAAAHQTERAAQQKAARDAKYAARKARQR